MRLHSVREAEERYQEKGADLVLLDVNLPDGEGFDFCQYLREKEPELGKSPGSLSDSPGSGRGCIKRV